MRNRHMQKADSYFNQLQVIQKFCQRHKSLTSLVFLINAGMSQYYANLSRMGGHKLKSHTRNPKPSIEYQQRKVQIKYLLDILNEHFCYLNSPSSIMQQKNQELETFASSKAVFSHFYSDNTIFTEVTTTRTAGFSTYPS